MTRDLWDDHGCSDDGPGVVTSIRAARMARERRKRLPDPPPKRPTLAEIMDGPPSDWTPDGGVAA